jgi:ribose transport system permease protein
LTKRWTDNAIPLPGAGHHGGRVRHRHNSFSAAIADRFTRQLGEFSIVVTGLTIVMLGGGIDLSIGSIFALPASRRSHLSS